MNINGIVIKTLDYIEKTRGLGFVDKVVRETLNYIEKTRRLEKEIRDYNKLIR